MKFRNRAFSQNYRENFYSDRPCHEIACLRNATLCCSPVAQVDSKIFKARKIVSKSETHEKCRFHDLACIRRYRFWVVPNPFLPNKHTT